MALIESWFNQDLQEPVKVRYLDGNVFSADNAGNLIGVNVFSNGSQASIAGSVAANVIRADGATVAVPGALSGNKATVVLNQSCYAVPGPISIIIKLTASGAITTLCAVVANVYQSSTDAVVDPGTIIPSIETLIAAIDAAVASIPPDYSSLCSEVEEIEQRFENNGDIFNMIRDTFINGYIANNGTVVPYNNYSYTDFIQIEPTTEYTFLARSQNGTFEIPIGYVASYNDNHEIVEYINGATVKDKTFAGAKYVRLSWYSATLSIAIFGQSVAFDTLITTKKEIPYKESPSQYVDLSSSDTKVTSWKRNSKLFPGHSVKAINRIGNIGGAPENSIAGFINAINAGFDILLVDIIWTADGIPVCCHDNDISRVARTNEGGSVSGVLISNTNYNTLYENYDFGIVKGEKYKGTKILRFDDFIRFVKSLDVYVYAEFKNFDSANYSVPDTVRIAYRMGMGDRVAWHGGFAVTRIIHNNFPDAAIAYYMASGAASDAEIANAISLKGENDVFLFGWDTTTFTNEQIDTLIQNNIPFECGTLNTEADIVSYIRNNPYCRGIESDRTVASIALIKEYIDY
jgi:hypothetical protein